jgi:hypothetical protein
MNDSMRLGNVSDPFQKSLTKTRGAHHLAISTLVGAQRYRSATAFFVLLSSNHKLIQGSGPGHSNALTYALTVFRLILGKLIGRPTGRR